VTDADVEALRLRLDRIERGLRRWRIFGTVAWGGLAASVALVFLLAFRGPMEEDSAQDDSSDAETVVEEEVKARAFVLVDDEGRPRAALAMRPDGTPALAFSSEEGRITWKAP